MSRLVAAAAVSAASLLFVSSARATITADQVIAYDPGTVQNSYWGAPYTQQSAVLGLPDVSQAVPNLYDSNGTQTAYADTSTITPFNASYNPSHVLAINDGGSITVHLSSPVVIGPGATLGIHSAAGLEDASYPSGQNSNPAGTYTTSRESDLQVSADGTHWIDLGTHAFDVPTNIYADAPDPYGNTAGTRLADFSKPFFGSLSSFNGADWATTLKILDGSAGGTWFDLSGINLPQVNYVRLQTVSGETMFVDAVVAVPEPGSLSASLLLLVLNRRRR